MSTKTLRVTLADIVGVTGPAGAVTGEVWARYSSEVRLTDGTIIVLANRRVPLNSSGVVDFTVVPNDDASVGASYQGFGIVVGWDLSYRGEHGQRVQLKESGRTITVTSADTAVVAFGLKAPAIPVIPATSYIADSAVDAWVASRLGDIASAIRVQGDVVYPTQSALGYGIPTATTYTAIQAAATAAATAGTRLVAAGTITTSSTLTLKCDADLSQLTINYTGSGAAVLFGDATTSFFRKTVRMPKVVATSKVTTGWAAVAGTVGIDVVNAYSCTVTVPYVQNFETGLRVRGDSTNGSQQTTFHLGHLDNNKVNIRFTGTATGWANQDHFYGGRCSHSSSEGSQVAGTRHVVFENLANPVNGHQFFGTSLESPDVVEYHVEAANSTWITLFGCRFENTGGDTHRRFLSTGASKNNRLQGGAYAENITQTVTSPALPFDIDTNAQTTRHGGTATVPTLLLENVNSSTASALTIMEAGAGAAGADPSTAYAVQATAQQWKGKRSTDSFNRLEIDANLGRIRVGDATAAPVGFIGGSASTVFVGGSLPFVPLTTATQDLGLSALRWRHFYLSGNVVQLPTAQTLASNGAVTITAATGDAAVTLQANATSSTITGAITGAKLTVTWIQDATGGRTYAWPANCKFAGAAAPADTTANRRTSVTFQYDGTNWNEQARAVAVG